MIKRKLLSIILSASLIITSVSFSVFADPSGEDFTNEGAITAEEVLADQTEITGEEISQEEPEISSEEEMETVESQQEIIASDEETNEAISDETEIEITEEESVETKVENGPFDNVMRIIDQPTDQEGGLNSTVIFSVGALNVASYQWFYSKDGVNWYKCGAASATSSNLSVKVTSTTKNYSYVCKPTDKDGNTTKTNVCKIILIPGVKLSKNPASVASVIGNTVHFSVSAENVSSGGYQWMYSKDGSSWYKSSSTGCNTDTLTIKVSSTNASYRYKCTMLGTDGNKKSSETAAIVLLTKAPSNVNAEIGETAKFTVTGSNIVSYQWQYSKDSGTTWYNSTATSAKNSSFSIKVSSSNINNLYRCKVTDSRGISGFTSGAGISKSESPVISKQPVNVHGCIDMTVTFSVVASNVKTYQWQYSKDSGTTWYNSGIASAKTDTLTMVQSESNQNNYYRCKLTSADGISIYTNTVKMEKHNLYYGYIPTSYPGPNVTQEHYIYCKKCGMKGPSEEHKWNVMSETAKCTVCGAYSYPDVHEDEPSEVAVPRALQTALGNLLRCSHPNASWKFAAGVSQYTCPDCGYFHYNDRA